MPKPHPTLRHPTLPRPTSYGTGTALVLALAFAAPALAQTSTIPGLSDPLPPTPSYTDPNQPPLPSTMPGGGASPGSAAPSGAAGAPKNITATGKTMPPPSRTLLGQSASSEAEMIKAQKATEARNKAWDAKMRKTMGSICVGC